VGTNIFVDFQRSHIDRMPLGNLSSTFLNLMIGYPHVNWIFRYQVDDRVFEFDDQAVKDTLQDVPLSEPSVIAYLDRVLTNGINEVAGNV